MTEKKLTFTKKRKSLFLRKHRKNRILVASLVQILRQCGLGLPQRRLDFLQFVNDSFIGKYKLQLQLTYLRISYTTNEK